MQRILVVLASASLLVGSLPPRAAADGSAFSSRLLPNRANQVIAEQAASTVDWGIRRGHIMIVPLGAERLQLTVRAKELIIPVLGFNPSPDFLARVVCHDAGGAPVVAAQTDPEPLSPAGNGKLEAVIELPADCFAPIVLIGGSTDPDGNRPGKWFAVSGF